jgi:hypothetical protein
MPPTFPSYRISSILKNTHVPLGPRRAVSHSQNVFFIESFIGEMAHATAKEFARRCSTCWSRKATGASRCPGWVIFDRRADRTDARHRLLTGRQERITREINKLQAIGQQILRKNSEPRPACPCFGTQTPSTFGAGTDDALTRESRWQDTTPSPAGEQRPNPGRLL